ncbi:hypothetical protein NMY22_g8396 [Coprinellus aureogranulatus]|nr:hypothetical protein NMY22_g8396 [Coprinellus aureogranulatus]
MFRASRLRLLNCHPVHSALRAFLSRGNSAEIDVLFFFIPWPDLTRLSATSSALRKVVEEYRKRIWNVNHHLHPFVDHAPTFRSILAFSGALVTGWQVIRFFDRLPPSPTYGLDIVTRVGGVVPLVLFLESIAYKRVPENPCISMESFPSMADVFQISSNTSFDSKGGATGIVAVLEYFRVVQESDRDTKIRIFVVTQSPVEHMLLSYHSTGVMNFISHKEAVSLFPKTTFLDRVIIPCSRDDLGQFWNPIWAREFREKGFRVQTSHSRAPFSIGERTVKGNQSWVIDFEDADQRLIAIEEERSIYGGYDIDDQKFDLVWMSEMDFGMRVWRLAVFEPKVFWYLIPTYMIR